MDEIFKRLQLLHPKIIDLKLNRVKRLLKKLGNPEKSLPPVIHVAGTNGKGSTIAMIKASLQSSGLSTHVYTSPHLINFNERIEIRGNRIKNETLNEILAECEKKNDSNPITFFEITTCAAFLAFSREAADYTIIEVGLGGEFDATNVVKNPVVSIITPISFDHMEYLGESIDQIAMAKAGIIKKNTPTVIAKQSSDVKKILEARCDLVGSKPIWSFESFTISNAKNSIIQKKDNKIIEFPYPNLIGVHQTVNAMTAISALSYLNVPAAHISSGLKSVYWPARLQKIEKGTLSELINANNVENELWVDGGHNADASINLRKSLSSLGKNKFHIIYGSLKNKDTITFLKNLSYIGSSLWVVEIDNQPSSLKKNTAVSAAKKAGWKRVLTAESIQDALKQICSTNHVDGRSRSILICGSLYLAGQALKENQIDI